MPMPMPMLHSLALAVAFLSVLWSGSARAQDCSGCNAFPTLCGKIDTCVKQCKLAPVQAQSCFQAGKMSLDQCKALYPQCKAADPACAACRSYPGLCKTIDSCIQKCNVAPFQAKNCFEGKQISLEQCNKLYPKCIDPCDGCNAFPTLCGKIDTCMKQCNVAPVQAQSCFQAGKMTLDQCKKLYPQCKTADPACAACRTYPGLCKTIDNCIQKCNVAPVQAQNCYQGKAINLEQCKKLYPQCK